MRRLFLCMGLSLSLLSNVPMVVQAGDEIVDETVVEETTEQETNDEAESEEIVTGETTEEAENVTEETTETDEIETTGDVEEVAEEVEETVTGGEELLVDNYSSSNSLPAPNNGWIDLSEDVEISGDLTLDYSLSLNGHKLVVNGNVIANKYVYTTGGEFVVNGDYIQKSGSLCITGSIDTIPKVHIKGDLRIQDKNSKGEYVKGNGDLEIRTYSGILTVDKNIYINTTEKISIGGTVNVGGDFCKESTYNFLANEINFTGANTSHVIKMDADATLGSFAVESGKIKVDGYLHGSIKSDLTVDVISKDKTLRVSDYHLYTDEYTVIINGDVDVENGNGIVVSKKLIISGNCTLENGALSLYPSLDSTSVHITGDLRVQNINDFSEYTTGAGGINIYAGSSEAGKELISVLTVDKNFYVDSSKWNFHTYGLINLGGDLYVYYPSTFIAENMALVGNNKQKLYIEDTTMSYINNLTITKPVTEYEFNPNKSCYVNLKTDYNYSYHPDGLSIKDGVSYLYINGAIATTFTGFYDDPSLGKCYIQKGVHDTSFTGVAKDISINKWIYVNNGIVDLKYSGIAHNPANGNTYYCKNGEVDWSCTSLMKEMSTGKWFYVQKGQVNYNYVGLAKNVANGRWYYVNNGAISWNFTGLAKNPANGHWYYVTKGEINWKYTGLAKNSANGNWYYVKNGEIDFSFTGIAKNEANGNYYYVNKGQLDWNFSGKYYDSRLKKTFTVTKGEAK